MSRRHMLRNAASFLFAAMLLVVSGCNPFILRFTARMIEHSGDDIAPANHIVDPVVPSVGLSVLWIGHASTLIQIGDRVIITDPSFTPTVGMVSQRLVAPGIDPTNIPRVDATLISHLHFDHFSYASLDALPKAGVLVIPPGGAAYTPEMGFADTREAEAWSTIEWNGLRITPVPVKHFGGRYGLDMSWAVDGYTGYVIEYEGRTVFFAGDTGYDPEKFKAIKRRFHVDLALIPIAPIEPHDFMRRVHADPREALEIFADVGARWMVPIHHGTFDQGLEPSPHFAEDQLRALIDERHLRDSVSILSIGERKVFVQ